MKNTYMIAYHGDEKLKKDFIREITKHEKADAIVQGHYGQGSGKDWKGCAVGCSLRSLRIVKGEPLTDDQRYSDHSAYETLVGVPRVLARLEDRVFEGLPVEEAKKWPRRFARAINVGANLGKVWPQFAQWLLTDEKDGVIRFANGRQDVIDAIKRASDLYAEIEAVDGGWLNRDFMMSVRDKALDIRNAAYAADADAAYTAAYAADADAAYTAAYAADAAAAAAAYTAAYAAYAAYTAAYAADADAAYTAAYAAARHKFWIRAADKLEELLKRAK